MTIAKSLIHELIASPKQFPLDLTSSFRGLLSELLLPVSIRIETFIS